MIPTPDDTNVTKMTWEKFGAALSVFFGTIVWTDVEKTMKVVSFLIAVAAGLTTLWLNYLKIRERRSRQNKIDETD